VTGSWSSLADPDRSEPHALRVTTRCIREDLDENPDVGVVELAATHAVVRRFFEVRARHPAGTDRVHSIRGDVEVYALRHPATVGATWHDITAHVVWLLALAHEGADPYDYFASLHRRRQLMPSAEDYEHLINDRIRAIAPAIIVELRALLSAATDANGDERAFVLRDGTVARLVVRCEGDEITDLWMALVPLRATPLRPGHLLGALLLDASEEDWRPVRRLPHRRLEAKERAFRFRPKGRS
jgi:hypothetical protein